MYQISHLHGSHLDIHLPLAHNFSHTLTMIPMLTCAGATLTACCRCASMGAAAWPADQRPPPSLCTGNSPGARPPSPVCVCMCVCVCVQASEANAISLHKKPTRGSTAFSCKSRVCVCVCVHTCVCIHCLACYSHHKDHDHTPSACAARDCFL